MSGPLSCNPYSTRVTSASYPWSVFKSWDTARAVSLFSRSCWGLWSSLGRLPQLPRRPGCSSWRLWSTYWSWEEVSISGQAGKAEQGVWVVAPCHIVMQSDCSEGRGCRDSLSCMQSQSRHLSISVCAPSFIGTNILIENFLVNRNGYHWDISDSGQSKPPFTLQVVSCLALSLDLWRAKYWSWSNGEAIELQSNLPSPLQWRIWSSTQLR